MKKTLLVFGLAIGLPSVLSAQKSPVKIFNNTRVINAHSTELPRKGELDFTVKHRFGDFAGKNGGFHTMYGFDGISDYRIGFEYGVGNKLMLGVGRTKGVYAESGTKEYIDALLKYKLLTQKENGTPIDLAFMANTAFSGMKAAEGGDLGLNAFDKFSHRFSYTYQLLLARRVSDRLALQLMPTLVYRNLVPYLDSNLLPAMGLAGKIGITKITSFVFDYYYVASPFRQGKSADFAFSNPLGLGVEFDTGKHVFDLNFTNSKALLENLYLPYTQSSWLKGGFRFGFTMSRRFTVK